MNSSVENVNEGEGEGAGIESGIEGERRSERRMKRGGWTGIDGYYNHIGPIRTRKSSRLVYISIVATRCSNIQVIFFPSFVFISFVSLFLFFFSPCIYLYNILKIYRKISRINLLD